MYKGKSMTYQCCTRCVMDNASDNQISFDSSGVCNYCKYALSRKPNEYFPNKEGEKKLDELVSLLKENGKNKDFDCLMGLSGGLDSSYLAYLGSKLGLRILAFHIDDGFNTPTAESNLKKLCEKAKINLIVETPDKIQFADVTKAFFLADLRGLCIPQDNLIFSYLYKNAHKYGITNFLSGKNFHAESILQRGGGHNASDGKHIRAISSLFGNKATDKLEIMNLFYSYVLSRYKHKITNYKLLNFIDYNNKNAIKELNEYCGFEYYGGKHRESYLTHYAMSVYSPEKFNYDVRRSHLSSLVIAGEITRDEALEELRKPPCDPETREYLINIMLESFQMNREDYERIMSRPPKSHTDYPHSALIKLAPIARKFRNYLNP